ncbi:putative cell division cycle protein 27-like [Apostichopus japonicus]|uniref:Cell division cycle protein 27 homolog n=1 Tax=Stichopus japonicus TaxID=307972 RepID=A0A2G8KGX7_STIJA|nr:putative cell division cycle protein 27-like [Apostichopus japonicus]
MESGITAHAMCFGSDDTLFLLATCYYRSGYPNRAHAILQTKGCPTPQCRFLMAKCSLELEKFSECEAALMGSSFPKNKSCEEVSSDFGDSAPFALQLLGKLCRKAERLNKATEAYKHCLKLNPFLWNSFQVLCDLGEKPDPESVFQLPPTSTLCTTSSQTDSCPIIDTENMTSHIITTPNQTPVNQVLGTPQENVFTMSGVRPLSVKTTPEMHFEVNITPDSNSGSFFPPPAPVSGRHTKTKPRPGRNIFGGGSSGSPLSPSFGILPLDTPSPGDAGSPTFISPQATDAQIPEPKAPRRAVRRGLPAGKPPKLPVFSQSGNNNSNTKESHSTALLPTSVPSPAQVLFTSAHHGVRRSSRLFSNANSVNASSVKENTSTKPTTRSKLGQTRATKGKTKTRGVKSSSITTSHESDLIIKSSESDEKLKSSVKAENYANLHAQILTFQKASAEGLLSLLRDLGSAYVSLTQFQCRKAIEKFSTIPPHHLNTGWIFSQLGRAHAELAEYQLAEKIFKRLRKLESHYLEGMEIYSTVLWHLHKEVELSALAQSLTTFDKNSPEVWCAVGNCFSVQKEHQTAINFFQRAIQVDPEFAYAYTLLGHEYVATEELEKAMKCFRNAIRINPRHYNGWYGIGMIYYRQEKFALAEVHYKKAIEINPQNAVLLVHLSVAQHALHKPDQSLALINRAMTLDRNNPLGRFQKASLLFATDKPQEALQELNELKQITPNESMIYFLMGKVYNKLGQTHLALASFSWAHDLDPKGSMSPVKEALDKHYLPDDDNSSQDLDEETYEGKSEGKNLGQGHLQEA